MKFVSKKFLLSLVALLAFSMILPVAAGTTWYVDDDGGSDFTSIQDAVDASSAGDTIIVRDGTYTENVDVKKRLTIRSENGLPNCIVNASITHDHVFDVTADYVNISGFAVKGATSTVGIYLYGVEHCIISNNTVSNNDEDIYLDHSNNKLTGNTAFNNEDGIRLSGSNNNTLTGNTANNNYC
ncbi:MAG: NosD domain-containing protein, partial [Halobacteriota archaeon]|nr:NosD domain-containing protein [Halobacteriota archaeon]